MSLMVGLKERQSTLLFPTEPGGSGGKWISTRFSRIFPGIYLSSYCCYREVMPVSHVIMIP